MDFLSCCRGKQPYLYQKDIEHFRTSKLRDKDRVICDLMTTWELIMDLFSGCKHYIALSCLFDLAQMEQRSQLNLLTVDERNVLLAEMDKKLIVLNDMINEQYEVRATVTSHWVDVSIIHIYQEFDRLQYPYVAPLGTPTANLFKFPLIDNTVVKEAWQLIQHNVPSEMITYPRAAYSAGRLVNYFGNECHRDKLQELKRFFSAVTLGAKQHAFSRLQQMEDDPAQRFTFVYVAGPEQVDSGGITTPWYFYFNGELLATVRQLRGQPISPHESIDDDCPGSELSDYDEDVRRLNDDDDDALEEIDGFGVAERSLEKSPHANVISLHGSTVWDSELNHQDETDWSAGFLTLSDARTDSPPPLRSDTLPALDPRLAAVCRALLDLEKDVVVATRRPVRNMPTVDQ